MRLCHPFAVFALAFALIAFPGQPAEPQDARSDNFTIEDGSGFEVRSIPSGAIVFVDGIRRGKTPLSVDALTAGEHRLVLVKEGWETRTFTFTIRDGVRLTASLKMKESTGLVHFSAKTAAATARPFIPLFLVDGESADENPVRLTEGPHRIRVRAFGFQDEERMVMVEPGSITELEFELKPAKFTIEALRLERARVNPANPGLLGESVLVFDASAGGTAKATLRDGNGTAVLSVASGPFSTWTQRIRIVARDERGSSLADGKYELSLEAISLPYDGEEVLTEMKTAKLSVDSSVLIRPATSFSGVGGLLFAPDATMLPAASFQMELGILGIRPYGSLSPGENPPFAAALRLSPSDGWELAATAVVEDDGSSLDIGLSVRRTLALPDTGLPLRTAFSLRWGSSSGSGPSAFALARGLEAAFPVEFGGGRAFALLAPSVSWTTVAGEAPSAGFSSGAGWRGHSWTAAFSQRTDADLFSGRMPEIGATLLGLELKLFPPPSVLVFSAFGGFWMDGGETGAFAGAGFGLLL